MLLKGFRHDLDCRCRLRHARGPADWLFSLARQTLRPHGRYCGTVNELPPVA